MVKSQLQLALRVYGSCTGKWKVSIALPGIASAVVTRSRCHGITTLALRRRRVVVRATRCCSSSIYRREENIMLAKLRISTLQTAVRTAIRPGPRQQRCFTSSPRCLTDGVYRELTAMRTRTSFIEAFRKQQEGHKDKVAAPDAPRDEKNEIDLTPKRMSDSFHKVVSSVQTETFPG